MVKVDLDIGMRNVEEVEAEYAVTIVLAGGVKIQIESPVHLSDAGAAPATLDPQDLPSDQVLHRAVFGRAVESAVADKTPGAC
jgi:hypothetical protein